MLSMPSPDSRKLRLNPEFGAARADNIIAVESKGTRGDRDAPA